MAVHSSCRLAAFPASADTRAQGLASAWQDKGTPFQTAVKVVFSAAAEGWGKRQRHQREESMLGRLRADSRQFPRLTNASPPFAERFLSPHVEQEQRQPPSERQLYYFPFPHGLAESNDPNLLQFMFFPNRLSS